MVGASRGPEGRAEVSTSAGYAMFPERVEMSATFARLAGFCYM